MTTFEEFDDVVDEQVWFATTPTTTLASSFIDPINDFVVKLPEFVDVDVVDVVVFVELLADNELTIDEEAL